MTHNQNITHRHYQQLQYAERHLIMNWLDQGNSYREIARRLGRNVATISREVKRGQITQIGHNHKIQVVYLDDAAQVIHDKHQDASHPISWVVKAPEFFDLLVKELKRQPRVHSVDSFVHWFKRHYPELPCPSTPTVYRYIDVGALELTNGDLPMKLRRRVKRPGKHHQRMNKHVLGNSIELRPQTAEDRHEISHWEGDLVKGKRVAKPFRISLMTMDPNTLKR